MSQFVVTTFDWVPEGPRGYVRDLRIRWALEEAGLDYRVDSISFKERGPGHLQHQPFCQVPWLSDGDISLFESGAILLHLAQQSSSLMPTDPRGWAETTQWLLAALNSVEMASLPWSIFKFSRFAEDTPEFQRLDGFLELRLQRLEPVFASHDWLAGQFTVADIAMADVLRLVNRFERLAGYPACREYLSRAVARPAFQKAHADQMAHFAAAD